MLAKKMHLRQKDGGCHSLGVAENFLQDSWIFRFSQNIVGAVFFIGTSGWHCSWSHNNLSLFCENFSFK